LNKIKSILLGLLLSTSVGAQNITMNVHNVALAEVLYELAEAAQLNLVLSHGLDFDISVVLQDVDARTGLTLVCKSVAVDCQYTQQGLVVGEATDQSNTQILPLHVVKLNYGEADSIMLALQSGQTMLSAKGQLLADNRSQQIFVYDDNAHAASLVEAIKLLDQPLAQILIEGRIVIAKSSLGQSSGLDFIGRLGPKAKAADTSGGQLGVVFNQLGGGLQLGLVGAHIMLNLELAALEAIGQVLTLSQPQILVQEGYAGSIQTGQEVPYIVATDNGQQQEWKRAVLGLTVTPRLLPKDQVQLDLLVVQDSIGDLLPNGQLALNTHKLKTRAVVGLGQTLVLGGALYQQQLDRLLTSPTLSGLPFIGQWFEQQKQDSERFELLVFVTPRIVNP
jgi:type IV pilus assembly protein PilQ|tara:strand:- start:23845 stop:25020 length:1176 start_codon:yes stop_codon:yes gene_type:complete